MATAIRTSVIRDLPGWYKWVALSNTTLGILMATINSSILLISLPAIFRGIGVNPLAAGETSYLLWLLLGYMVVTATLVVTFGRISDMVGRVKMYNLGFAVFTVGSLLLFLAPGTGNRAALELIIFRLVQGVGGAFLFANSTAILIDAFPLRQRGTAMGINQVAAIAGSLGGLLLGGVLSTINWRLVFLVSVPFGLFGTVWAFKMLRETATIRSEQRLDILGNVTFAVGLTALLVGLTYGIMPYRSASMGWGNPLVVGALVLGSAGLVGFVVVELRARDPMFRLSLFGLRPFSAGNIAALCAATARGGLQFMLIIWLQGIWLPMHGYPFASTPFWSAIYTLPMLAGFLLMGPISGVLSDRFGQRLFTVGGMLIGAVGFIGLTLLPADFQPWQFFSMQVIVGIGLGMFSAPNTTAVMNAVPSHARGVASGMRATFQNVGMLLSMSIFFTMLTVGLAGNLPRALTSGLTAAGVPAPIAGQIGTLPPTAALFSAFLGYNPLGQLLPQSVLAVMSPSAQRQVLSTHFFPSLIMAPFMHGLSLAFYLSTSLALAAAVASYLCTDRQRKAPTTVSGEARAPIDVSMRPSLQPSPDDAVGKGRSIA